MSTREDRLRTGGWVCLGIGLVLAIVFFILYAVSSGNLRSAYLSAAMICLVAAAYGLGLALSGTMDTARWVGLGVGAAGFVAWGIAWLAHSCSAADTACTDLDTSFGWGAIFSAIGAVASLFPGLFGGSGQQQTSSQSQN